MAIPAKTRAEPRAITDDDRKGFIAGIRAMASALMSRGRFSRGTGKTYDGQRDVDAALGYQATLSPQDYRARYERNEMAGCIVEAFPIASWRGGGELVEDEDPENVTPFEDAFFTLADRVQLWPRLLRADILAGLGRYAIVVIIDGLSLETELKKMSKPDEVLWLTVFAEDEADITEIETDPTSSRYGRPKFYAVSRVTPQPSSVSGATGAKQRVHWSRTVHVADGLLDDDVYGTPRLQRTWNRIDDLVKVVGGGSEAFWQRSQQGLQLDIDKDIDLDEPGKKELQDEVDEYLHGMRRVMRTQGVNIKPLGSDVANFGSQVDALLTLIAGGSRIPKRILTGSEMGELASSQDKTNWDERVQDRRENFCGPAVVRQLVDRLIEYGALKPSVPDGYAVRWPEIENMDEMARANIALRYAQANKASADAGMGAIITENEIRDGVLDLDPVDEAPSPDPNEIVEPAAVPVAAFARRAICLERLRMAKVSMRAARIKAATTRGAKLVAAVKKKSRATLSVMPQTGTRRERGAS